MSTVPTTPAPRVGVSLLIATLLAVATVALVLFLPVLIIGDFYNVPGDVDPNSHNAEMGVGIAVVVRATARRLLRSGVQNMLRTTLGAFTRTAARTMTRRISRVVLRQLMGITMATVVREMSGGREATVVKAETDTLTSSLVAIGLGFVGLMLSFRVILYLIGPEKAGSGFAWARSLDRFGNRCSAAAVTCRGDLGGGTLVGNKNRVPHAARWFAVARLFHGGQFLPTADNGCRISRH